MILMDYGRNHRVKGDRNSKQGVVLRNFARKNMLIRIFVKGSYDRNRTEVDKYSGNGLWERTLGRNCVK